MTMRNILMALALAVLVADAILIIGGYTDAEWQAILERGLR